MARDIIKEEDGAIYVEDGEEITANYDKEGILTGGTLKVLANEVLNEFPV